MNRLAMIVIASLLGAFVAWGQTNDEVPIEAGDFVIRTESNLVVVPLHVYQKKNSVNGLGKEAFELREDGVPQEIAFVEGPSAEDGVSTRSVPTEIIFLIDFSFSVMRPGLLDLTTVRSTLLEGLRDDVLISVYGFANSLKRFTGPTRDLKKLQWALDQTYESEAGGSRVYEAIMQTARDATNRGGGNASRMMVVFSDGLSTTKMSTDMVVQVAQIYGIPLYPIILGHDRIVKRQQQRQRRSVGVFGPSRQPPVQGGASGTEQESLMRVFADVGRRTGGRSYDLEVLNNKVLRRILESLSELAETEYVVGYYPRSVDETPTPHEVSVSLASDEIGKLYGGYRLVVH